MRKSKRGGTMFSSYTREEKITSLIKGYQGNNLLLFKLFLSQKTDEQLDSLLEDELEKMSNFAYGN